MVKRDDKLKNLLSGGGRKSTVTKSAGPEEVNISGVISPVAKIIVVWVGWGWQNAVNRMIESGLDGVDFIAMNTDVQALYNSLAWKKLHIWKVITWGLWAWSDPDKWKKAAEESREDIKALLNWADMVFITCGLGWWTWTWAAPVVAEVAKELWALTVWVVTKPFSFEGQRRMSKSIDGYESLKEKVDTLITIPNDRILSIIDKKTPLLDAFSIVDEVLNQWVQWISDLITQSGLINVDFADVNSVMNNAWSALMGIWFGTWEDRAVEAAKAAIDSPLLELSIAWAKWLLFNVTWWTDLSMFEVDEAARVITENLDPDANIIFWATIKEDYEWEVKITVVATWFDEKSNKDYSRKEKSIISSTPSVSTGSSFSEPKKINPFGKRSVTDSRVTPSMQSRNNVEQDQEDDLDIPTFLRKRKM